MSLARLIKTGASLMSGQGIMILNQLLLPPLFLRSYGVTGYGEWLTLASAAQYLGTLNFGLHNFANNHVTIAHNRGDMDEVNVIQGTSFAIMLSLVAVISVLATFVFLLPLSKWLHLSTISSTTAAATVYFLGASILVRLVFGFLHTAFLVIGAYHRGSNWNNFQFVGTILVTALLVAVRTPFVWIALSQPLTTLFFTILVGIDLRIKAPVAFPKLRYASRKRVMDVLRPSGYFGMLFSSSFLVYQLPIIIMQRMLGPLEVVLFSITRTVFSMPRQALTALSTALGPEITESYGKRNWNGLCSLYDLSERVVFSLVPVVSLSTFLATPALMSIWVHKPELFRPDICVYMALISAAAGVKEHKYQFQISINEHAKMARFIFFTYIAMILVTVPAIARLGIRGFLFLWLTTEVAQVLYIVSLNRRLFSQIAKLTLTPLYRVALVIALGITLCWFVVRPLLTLPIYLQLAIAAGFAIALLGVEYPIFRLSDIRANVVSRLLRRTSPEALQPAG